MSGQRTPHPALTVLTPVQLLLEFGYDCVVVVSVAVVVAAVEAAAVVVATAFLENQVLYDLETMTYPMPTQAAPKDAPATRL